MNKRLIPFLIAFINYALLEVYFFRPSLIYVVLVLMMANYMFVIRQFLKERSRPADASWFHFAAWPLSFSAGLVAFTLFLPDALFVQILFIVYWFFSYYYLSLLRGHIQDKGGEGRSILENFSAYANFISFYFLSSAVYGLQVFLSINISSLIFAVILFSGSTVAQVFWANSIKTKENFHFLLIIVLVLTEIAWAISFLTLSFYILGLILAISYYILIGIFRYYIKGTLDFRLVKLYLIFGFSSLLIVLLTTRWISSN